MRQGFQARHAIDSDGNPAGGVTQCPGDGSDKVFFHIGWQDGPMKYVYPRQTAVEFHSEEERKAVPVPNGAFVEDVIDACIDRINFYQKVAGGKFACRENSCAIVSLEEALDVLDARTKRRQEAGVHGTQIPDSEVAADVFDPVDPPPEDEVV